MSGSWMQSVAQGLLVLDLTGSGTALGFVVALQTLPVLFFGAYGGVIVDRYPKRSILYWTQGLSCISSLIMGALVLTGDIRLWMVYLMAMGMGFVKVFDNPTRQTFVREMVGNDLLTNAVSLNSMEMNLARVVGPTLAAVLIAVAGIGWCFIVDGLSFIIVIYMLWVMRPDELHPAPMIAKARGQTMEGFRYIMRTPVIRNILIMMAIIGTFTYEFNVTLPLLSEFEFKTGDTGYAALTAAMGLGAGIGGIYTAGKRRTKPFALIVSASIFSLSMFLVSIAPSYYFGLACMLIVGFCSINFTSLANVTLQLSAREDMQGRVMSFWTIAFMGTTPIGGPIIGFIGEHMGARSSLFVGALAAGVAAVIGMQAIRKSHDAPTVTSTSTMPSGPKTSASKTR